MAVSKTIFRQMLACVPVILNQFLVGIGAGWTAPTLAKLNDADFALTATVEQASWLAAIHEVGRVLGPFVSPALVDNIGRRYTLTVITTTFSVVWLAAVFVRDIWMLCALRVLFGLAMGVHDVVAGIYTTENCAPDLRGIVGGIVFVTYFAAMFVEFVVTAYLSYAGTAIANLAMVACVFATLYFGVETPYFLMMKGKRDEAERNLTWLSGKERADEVADELRQIGQSVSEEREKSESLKLLFSSPSNLKGILVVVGMHVLAQATGGGALVSYASLIFSPSETLTASQYTILFGAAQIVAAVVSPFIIERINRRTLMIASFVGFTFSNVCSYALISSRSNGYAVVYYPWLIFVAVSLYGMFSSVMNPVLYALKGELLPLSVRSIGSSMAVTSHAITTFCTAKIFFPVSERYGMHTNFLIYSAFSFVATIFIYRLVPETRGKTLHELQNAHKKGKCVESKEVSDDKTKSKYVFV